MSGTHGDRVALEVFQHLDNMKANVSAKRVVKVYRGHPDTEATIKHVVRWSRLRGVPIKSRKLTAGHLVIVFEGGA